MFYGSNKNQKGNQLTKYYVKPTGKEIWFIENQEDVVITPDINLVLGESTKEDALKALNTLDNFLEGVFDCLLETMEEEIAAHVSEEGFDEEVNQKYDELLRKIGISIEQEEN